MTTTMPSRAAIEAAGDLEWNSRKPARQDLTITITARIDGFDTEVCYTGSIEQLLAVTKRLRELGAEPVSAKPAATSPAAPQRTKSTKVTPEYDASGEPCCPKHHKPLKTGQFGLYCSAKDDSQERGFCALKFDV